MKKQLQNEPDIVGLLTRIQEQLAALDKKVDVLMNKPLPQAGEMRHALQSSLKPPVHAHVQAGERKEDHRKGRLMHPAVCADCKKECEVPFKPSGDRPVFCQECFSRRKASRTLKTPGDQKPKEAPPLPSVINASIEIPEPPAREKKKPSAAKRPEGKKKLAAKKKKR